MNNQVTPPNAAIYKSYTEREVQRRNHVTIKSHHQMLLYIKAILNVKFSVEIMLQF